MPEAGEPGEHRNISTAQGYTRRANHPNRHPRQRVSRDKAEHYFLQQHQNAATSGIFLLNGWGPLPATPIIEAGHDLRLIEAHPKTGLHFIEEAAGVSDTRKPPAEAEAASVGRRSLAPPAELGAAERLTGGPSHGKCTRARAGRQARPTDRPRWRDLDDRSGRRGESWRPGDHLPEALVAIWRQARRTGCDASAGYERFNQVRARASIRRHRPGSTESSAASSTKRLDSRDDLPQPDGRQEASLGTCLARDPGR